MTSDAISNNSADAAMPSRISKNKIIRINLEGDEFLDFHAISGRLSFNEKLSERANDEEVIKIALRLLKREIDYRIHNGDKFISAASL